MLKRLQRGNGFLAALIILTFLWTLFFWRILTPTPADRVVFAEGDFTQHYYAFASYQVERLWQGEFPLWNPYNYAGDPFAGNIQFSTFYPPRLLAAFLLGRDGYSIEDYQLEVAAHYWIASLLMFAFIHALTKRAAVAIFGSVLYTYSGYLTGYPLLQVSVLESVIWLPLIMLGIHESYQRPRWVFAGCALGGVGIALSLLGGHPQTTMQISYLGLAYLVYLGYQKRLPVASVIIRAGVLVAVGAGLSAIQLLPALEFTRLSYRITDLGYLDKANGFAPVDFFQVFVPGIFGDWSPLYLGAAGLLLAFGGLFHKATNRVFWMPVIMIGLLLSLGGSSIVYDFFYVFIPGFGIFRQQERAAAVVVFALVVLACEYLALLLDKNSDETSPPFSQVVYGYTGLLFVICIALIVMSLNQPQDKAILSAFAFASVNAVLFAVWFYWQRNYTGIQGQIVAPLILLLVVDLFTIGSRLPNYHPDTPENRVQLAPALTEFPTPVDQITWRVDGASSLQGYGVYFRIPDIYGTGPFTVASTEQLRQIPVERFWEVLSARYVTTIDEPPSTIPLDLLAYGANYEGQEFKLFELHDPRPMAHLVYDYRQAEGSPEFARQIMADPRVNLREMAITLYPLPYELPVTRPDTSRVDNFQIFTPEHIEMTISTGADALLTVAMVNYPGWSATIDGQPIEIADTYAGLIGIPVRTGENQQVVLAFRPSSVLFGAVITAVTAILTLIASFISFRR